MNRDENDSSEQQQGFYKPQLRVVLSNDSPPPQGPKPQQFASEANDLISFKRPQDFLPRVLSTSPPIYEQLIDLNLMVSHQKQQLFPIPRQKAKRCKYLSLKDKYSHNELYKLIYSKVQAAGELSSYIFSLNHTTDYNPNNYQQIALNEYAQHSKFQSRFQSGNLLYAYRCLQSKIQEYDLILQNDTNTKGYNQWFYFSFRNEQSRSVRFNVVNLVKKHSLFEEGVKPVGFSQQRSQKGWHTIGSSIDYQKSYVCRQVSANPAALKNYYTLSFTVDFQLENDVLYIALNYPYTYSRMLKFVNEMPEKYPQILFQKSIIAYTISNNALPLIRIKHPQYKEGGKKILIMGRQHPGESVSSFVLEGFMHNLLKEQKMLRSFQVILIPMVNPDGVIYGNFRTNLAGFDLNRQWMDPNKWMHPQIYYISKYVSNLENISFVIDFHGHSKKYNSFIYACIGENPYLFRLFPYICGQQTDHFALKDCTFNITADKQKTARVKLYRQIKKPQVFTLQTSFFGYMDPTSRKYRYQINDLLEIGSKISQSLKIFLTKRKELLQFQKEVKEKEYLFDQWNFQNKDDMDSQSNPSEDELTPFERKEKVISEKANKKRKSKSKKKKGRSKEETKANLNFMDSKLKNGFDERKQLVIDKNLKAIITERLPQAIVKKKSDSVRLVHFSEIKVNKKIQKALAIISPPLPKNSTPNIIATNPNTFNYNTTSNFQLKAKKKSKQVEFTPPPPIPEQKRSREEPPSPIKPSNLLNTTNYYAQIHEKLKKDERASSLHQKTQSLEINNLKREVIFPKGNTLNVLKRLISNEDDEEQRSMILDSSGRGKHREKVFMVRQNRGINFFARVQEDEFKRNLEDQINNRTQALRNCQKKMREMSLDEPILQSNEQISPYQTSNKHFFVNSTPKSYKFPTIRMEKKLDYFNF